MDEGETVSGVSRGHQRRLYDQRRAAWVKANGLRLVILDYRGFETDREGRLRRDGPRDRQIVTQALRAAGVHLEPGREAFDLDGYIGEVAQGCFICRLVEGDPGLPAHHVIWRNDEAIAFLDRFPTVYGYTLVAPIAHREQVSGDFSLQQYLGLQRVVYAVAEAVRLALKPERVYVLSLGSRQANAHVHWHVVPCPPGVLLIEQQGALIDKEKRGVLKLDEEEGRALALRLRSQLPRWMQETV